MRVNIFDICIFFILWPRQIVKMISSPSAVNEQMKNNIHTHSYRREKTAIQYCLQNVMTVFCADEASTVQPSDGLIFLNKLGSLCTQHNKKRADHSAL